jgi:hypothetical protein
MTAIVGLGVKVSEVANRRATAMEAIARVEAIARKRRGKAVPASKTRKIQLMKASPVLAVITTFLQLKSTQQARMTCMAIV